MNRVNDNVQELFTKYEKRYPNRQKQNGEDVMEAGALSEIQILRRAWEQLGGNNDYRDFEGSLKRTFYVQMYEQVRNKLAMKIETVQGDYWFTPPQHQETVNLLWEIAGTLRKAAVPWWRHIARVGWVITESLLYLGILVALLLFSHSSFETRVFASMALVYNNVRLQCGALGLDLAHLRSTMGEQLDSMARTMKLKSPVMDLEASEKLGIGILLTYVSLITVQVGNLIAIVVLVWSLF